MKFQLVAVCLLATPLARAQAPAGTPSAEELQQVRTEVHQVQAEVQQVDPKGQLTNEQLYDLLMTREARRRDARDPPSEIFIMFFLTTMGSFLAWLFASYRKERQRHETVRLMVEKGVEVPSGLLAPPPKRPSDLRRGIILSTAGLGLAISLAFIPHVRGAWGAGLTLLMIGVGHLLVWRMQGGRGPLPSALSSEPVP
jgi:Domain of unknown function (DUF6249)